MYVVNFRKNKDWIRRTPKRENFLSDFNISSATLYLTLKIMVNSHTKLGFFCVHNTNSLASLIYYRFISGYIVWITFTLDAFNDLDSWACDIGKHI